MLFVGFPFGLGTSPLRNRFSPESMPKQVLEFGESPYTLQRTVFAEAGERSGGLHFSQSGADTSTADFRTPSFQYETCSLVCEFSELVLGLVNKLEGRRVTALTCCTLVEI